LAAKQRQAEILKRFAKQQQQFMEQNASEVAEQNPQQKIATNIPTTTTTSSSSSSNKTEAMEISTTQQQQQPSKTTTTTTHNDYENINSGGLCAICRSEVSDVSGRTLGVLALVQPSRIPVIAKDQDVKGGNKTVLSETIVTKTTPDYIMSSGKQEETNPTKRETTPPTTTDEDDIDEDEESDDDIDEDREIDEEDGDGLFDNLLLNTTHRNNTNPTVAEFPARRDERSTPPPLAGQTSFFDVNEMECATILCCGHCMHDDCYQNFVFGLLPRNTLFPPQLESRKEFNCPICRRHCNALLPLVSSPSQTHSSAMMIDNVEPLEQTFETLQVRYYFIYLFIYFCYLFCLFILFIYFCYLFIIIC